MTETRLTDRDLIESIISNFYIVDYGFVSKVQGDKVDVVHAVKPTARDGKEIPQIETKGVELLFLSGSGFSIKWDIQEGDRVLLLGLKDYVKSAEDVKQAEEADVFIHYNRSTMKALPLCVFNADASVRIEIEKGKMKIEADDDVELKGKGKLKLNTQDKIELNGSSKQFVTWTELNTALQSLVTTLNTHTHVATMIGSPTAQPVPTMTIDISSAKTTTVVTGG